MIDWDIVRKNRMLAKRGTDDDKDVLKTLAPLWRKPFKPPVSKAELREQATEAQRTAASSSVSW